MGRRVDADNPNLEGRYGPWRAYGQSKLANYHFAIGLHNRLRTAGVTTMSLLAHPGLSNTELQATSVIETDGGSSQKFFPSPRRPARRWRRSSSRRHRSSARR
jgi:NAD(P)-dependent dehydrogenase (short-subunit alcohol dehydrogenase family)